MNLTSCSYGTISYLSGIVPFWCPASQPISNMCREKPLMLASLERSSNSSSRGGFFLGWRPVVRFLLVSLPTQVLTPNTTRRCESIVPLVPKDQRPACSQRPGLNHHVIVTYSIYLQRLQGKLSLVVLSGISAARDRRGSLIGMGRLNAPLDRLTSRPDFHVLLPGGSRAALSPLRPTNESLPCNLCGVSRLVVRQRIVPRLSRNLCLGLS